MPASNWWQYGKPVWGLTNLGNSLSGGSLFGMLNNLMPGMSSVLPWLGPAITLGSGLAGGATGGPQAGQMGMSAMSGGLSALGTALGGSAAAGPLAAITGPAAIASLVGGVTGILENETAQEKMHNVKERLGQSHAAITDLVDRIASAGSPEELLEILKQPYGDAGTVGGVLKSIVDANLSGQYLGGDYNKGGAMMYWEPDKDYLALQAGLDKYGFDATPYSGDQGSGRINNITELIANSAGAKPSGDLGYPAKPDAQSGIANWDKILTALSDLSVKADPTLADASNGEWGWNDDNMATQAFGLDMTDPEKKFYAYDQYKSNPTQFAGTGRQDRWDTYWTPYLDDEDWNNQWRDWRLRVGFRDEDDMKWLNRNNTGSV